MKKIIAIITMIAILSSCGDSKKLRVVKEINKKGVKTLRVDSIFQVGDTINVQGHPYLIIIR